MRIVFIKACIFNRQARHIGNITTVVDKVANELILQGKAVPYTGQYPPTSKIETDFFKPKDIDNHGKEHG